MEQQTGSKMRKEYSKTVYHHSTSVHFYALYYALYALLCTLLLSLLCTVHHEKCQAGWITSWNQDCWGKYQQFQICRWYHSNSRKWRTKEPLDEGKRREWKSGLKIPCIKKKKKSHTLATRHKWLLITWNVTKGLNFWCYHI